MTVIVISMVICVIYLSMIILLSPNFTRIQQYSNASFQLKSLREILDKIRAAKGQ